MDDRGGLVMSEVLEAVAEEARRVCGDESDIALV